MTDLHQALKQKNFRWLPKHLNHIAENIVFKKRNISFLAINALFRQENFLIEIDPNFSDSFIIVGYLPLLANDKLRTRAEILKVVFDIDKHNNIIPITAYSENDKKTIS
jgi:hypothetical protein